MNDHILTIPAEKIIDILSEYYEIDSWRVSLGLNGEFKIVANIDKTYREQDRNHTLLKAFGLE